MNWTFKCYVSETGRCDVQSEYDQGSAQLKAGFDIELEYLSVRKRHEWTNPRNHAAKLSSQNDFKDFYEIRFKADNVQQRPIGYFGPGENEFTIVFWATEKGNQLKPKDWFKICNKRRLQIVEGTATVRCFKQDGDEDEHEKTESPQEEGLSGRLH